MKAYLLIYILLYFVPITIMHSVSIYCIYESMYLPDKKVYLAGRDCLSGHVLSGFWNVFAVVSVYFLFFVFYCLPVAMQALDPELHSNYIQL